MVTETLLCIRQIRLDGFEIAHVIHRHGLGRRRADEHSRWCRFVMNKLQRMPKEIARLGVAMNPSFISNFRRWYFWLPLFMALPSVAVAVECRLRPLLPEVMECKVIAPAAAIREGGGDYWAPIRESEFRAMENRGQIYRADNSEQLPPSWSSNSIKEITREANSLEKKGPSASQGPKEISKDDAAHRCEIHSETEQWCGEHNLSYAWDKYRQHDAHEKSEGQGATARDSRLPFETADLAKQSKTSSFYVPLEKQGGIFVVPVEINSAITLKFIIDSGAADVSIPADVALTLMRTGTLVPTDFKGSQTYILADGSTIPSQIFRIRSLKIGNKELRNVNASVAPVQGPLLLGQSFLSRFKSWLIDNERQVLVLQ